MSNKTNNEPSMVRQLHILACAILGLDDEDHEDDELAAPLEQVINLYAQKMVVVARKQAAIDIFNLAHQYAQEDKTMHGSEDLRSYHYFNAIHKIGEFDGR